MGPRTHPRSVRSGNAGYCVLDASIDTLPQSIHCFNRYILGSGRDKRGASPNYQLDQKLRVFRFPSVLSKCWRNYSIYDPARARGEINSIFNWDMPRLEYCKLGSLHFNQNNIACMTSGDKFQTKFKDLFPQINIDLLRAEASYTLSSDSTPCLVTTLISGSSSRT